MVLSSLVEYIKKYKDQYGVERLRSYLIIQGYSPEEVDTAIAIALKKSGKTGKKLLKPAIITIFLIIILFLSYYFWPAQELEIHLTIVPEKTVLLKGENLLFSAYFGVNKNYKKKGLYNYVLLDEKNNVIFGDADYITIEKQQKKDFPLILEQEPPGNYSLKFNFSVEDKEVTEHFSFEIREKIEEKTETKTTCPFSCDDNNPNTKDECVNGKCVNTVITKCGNNICDAGESVFSCAEDCKIEEEAQDRKNFKEEAIALARTDPEKAANNCLQLVEGSEECLIELNKITDNVDFCKAIENVESRDLCFSSHILRTTEYEFCDLIKDSYRKKACYNLKRLKKLKSYSA